MFRVGILTISDSAARGLRPTDASGEEIRRFVAARGWQEAAYAVVADEAAEIMAVLRRWADQDGLDLILTTGGTGMGPRDVTPEATLAVIDRQVPGIPEAVRWKSLQITPHAMISRAVSGIRGRTWIINLPGSPKGVREALEIIEPALQHGLELLRGISSH
jgi:molybdenum cofactor synthesis domain-containing protein